MKDEQVVLPSSARLGNCEVLKSETLEREQLCITEKRRNGSHDPFFGEWYKNRIFGYITSAVGRIK